jgi:ParB family chromosome partitioning protein
MDKLGEQQGLSKNTIARYLRVNELIPALKELLDDERFGICAAISLSYLRQSEQELLHTMIRSRDINIGIRQADKLRKESAKQKLTKPTIKGILNSEKPVKVKPYKAKSEVVSEFFVNSESDDEIGNVIEEALRAYFAR